MLIIFDCDGVLVDSEALAAQVFSDCLQKQDIPYTPDDCRRTFVGLTLDACMDQLRAEGHQVPQDFKAQLFEREHVVFGQQLKPVPGVTALIEKLIQKNIPYCVASNGGLAKIHRSLTITGLLPFFSSGVFSSEQVAKGKPAPDLFLFAAESMGVLPEHCLVIEDSVAGVRAASAAGMNVLRYGDEVAHLSQGQPLSSMAEVYRHLQHSLGCGKERYPT